ncbi:MAG TPA: zinc-dependent metalloprotease [Thermoanaerobaculia bacterium]|nr:zinc-dependent metalloprotease [Thermoanaerobaculia bacterium]
MSYSLCRLSPSLALGLLLAAAPSFAAPPAKEPDIAARTAGMAKKEGLLTFYLDAKAGKVWLEVPPARGKGGEVGTFIYVDSILTGLGSNPVGLDRGQLGDTRIVTLRRLGGRLLVEQQNLRFRALSENPDELRAVRESFATSVLWGGEITGAERDGRALVDFTGFLVRDAHDIPARMRLAGQGSWSLDAARSVADLENCLAFPDNVEFESLLTYQSNEPGDLVRQTAPYAGAVTLVQHHSFVRLPDAGYTPREFDPRAGSFPVTFADYAAPLAAPIEKRWISRHRLEKVDPAAARSRVKEPIVYYVDPAAPEPVQSALIEGVSWWKDAFEKAGFIDAFRVEVLPPGAHPLDVRYNVVQWVHRSTRGWSYGGGVIDPRTGEILSGHVTLGSLRVRQDRLIFEGLAGTEKTGTGAPDDPVVLSLARIRQLAVHEVGHSLGFSHNFAASTYGRASVMDYPAPRVDVGPDGNLDFSSAYAVGMGEWDLWAVRYAYTQLPPGTDERPALQGMIDEAIRRGLLFLTDEDARPPGAANPRAVLWDNGPDPVAGLRQSLEVRRIALSRFGEHNIQPGQPLALLQEVLVPLYFHHRYQLDGALKVVGGVDYTYAVRGDGQPGQKPVEAKRQRDALQTILGVLEPERLDLPEAVIALLLPRPSEYRPHPELFRGNTAPVFDPLAAAATMADMAVVGLLQPERAARLVDLHRRDPQLPGLEEVLDALVEKSFGGPVPDKLPNDPRRAEIRRVVQWVTVRRMIGLSSDPDASPLVRARLDGALRALAQRLEPAPRSGSGPEAEQRAFLAAEIGRYLKRPEGETAKRPVPPEPPPGQPIGMAPEGLSGCSQE